MRHEPSLVTLVLLWLRLDTTGGGMCPHTPLPCHELTICGERGTHDPLHLSLILDAAIVLLLNSLFSRFTACYSACSAVFLQLTPSFLHSTDLLKSWVLHNPNLG